MDKICQSLNGWLKGFNHKLISWEIIDLEILVVEWLIDWEVVSPQIIAIDTYYIEWEIAFINWLI